MISTDRKVFDPESAVHKRMVEYGELVDELHIIVFSSRKHDLETASQKLQISDSVFAYPTNSLNRWLYVVDAIKLGKKIIENPSDLLVTAQDPFETGCAGYRLARYFEAPLQLQVHTDFLNPFFKRGLLNTVRVPLAKFLLPRADCVRVVSERIKKSIQQKIGVQDDVISVLPIFVDVCSIKEQEPERNLRLMYPQHNPLLLMVSRLEKEKGFERAFEVMEETSQQFTSALLLIVGKGSERAALEKEARERGLEDNVKFVGWQKDLTSFYKGADVYLHTSYYEGYGRTLVEAAAAGCPIVTTDVGIAGDLLVHEESARVCSQKNPICLPQEMNWVLEHRSKSEEMAQRAQENVLRHGFTNKADYLQEMENLWRECSRM